MDISDGLKKCSNDKELYKFIFKIRTKSINNEAAIEKFSINGVKALSLLLSDRIKKKTSGMNEKILETLLSILGNCTCYNKNAALQAYEANIADTLICIFNNSDNPSIKSKVCRLIGNLAQTDKISASLQSVGVALNLSNCTAENIDSSKVFTMAIRAMRIMWNLKRFRHQILSYGTIFKIIMCLHELLYDPSSCDNVEEEEEDPRFVILRKPNGEPDRRISKEKLQKIIESQKNSMVQFNYDIWPTEKKKKVEFSVKYEDKESLEVINGILKFILTIVNSSLLQVAASLNGIGIKLFLFLTGEVKFRTMALKILSSFAYNTTTIEYLKDVSVEICNLFVKNSNTIAANDLKNSLAIICLLSENVSTRLIMRHSGMFKTLLEIALNTKLEEELNLIIYAFCQYKYDEAALEELVRLNLVNVLIKIASNLIAKMNIDHITIGCAQTRKRHATEALNIPHLLKFPCYESSHRPASPIASPRSTAYGGSFNQMSPTTSGYSPFNSPVRCYHDYDSDSNQYSPVCSDNEEDLDRMEAKVLEIIDRKSAVDGEFQNKIKDLTLQQSKDKSKILKSQSQPVSMGDYAHTSKSKIEKTDDERLKDVLEEAEPVQPVKDDFDILDFIYNNEEVGKSTEDVKKELTSEEKSKSNIKNKKIKRSKKSRRVSDKAVNEEFFNDQSDNEDTKPNDFSKSSKPQTLQEIEDDKLSFIIFLLWRASLKYSNAPAFVQPENLQTLIRICRIEHKNQHAKSYKIIQNVVEQTRNFVAIFQKQNFVFDIFSLSRTENHENCYSCDTMKMISRQLLIDFSKIAQDFGRGEIVRLMTGDEETKKKTAVKLLYIVRCPDMLNNLLFYYKALEIVLDVIFKDDELSVHACNGLTIMAENLNIKIPSDDETLSNIIPDDFKSVEIPQKSTDIIKFIVSDGEIFLDKSILMESSEVFNSMLSSDFRETKFNEINFPTYTVDGMQYFYQLLIMQKSGVKSIAPKVDDIEVLLQSFELSNLYIIDIQQPLLNLIKIVINETNVMKVFEWSLENVNQELLISSICYFLCSKIEGEKKLKLFIEANESKYGQEWRKLIIDSISMKCKVVD